MKTHRLIIPVLLLSMATIYAAQEFTSGPERTDLIELFTSEGCSSCPPADRKMNALVDSKGLWKDFVPVAFHVDYWDYLGWTDPYSSPEFSARQRTYSKEWKARTVYTPCFVTNGEIKGSAKGARPGVLSAQIDDHQIHVAFRPDHPLEGKLTAWIAPLSGDETSRVTAGENRGQKLEHRFVALGLQNGTMDFAHGMYSANLPVSWPDNAKAVAVWLSIGKSLKPLQATGGWLKP